MKRANEYTAFTDLARKLLSVPNSEVRAKLDAEKAAKKDRKKQRPESGSSPKSRP